MSIVHGFSTQLEKGIRDKIVHCDGHIRAHLLLKKCVPFMDVSNSIVEAESRHLSPYQSCTVVKKISF